MALPDVAFRRATYFTSDHQNPPYEAQFDNTTSQIDTRKEESLKVRAEIPTSVTPTEQLGGPVTSTMLKQLFNGCSFI
uniref:Uncharacterized protein n=1 Tax=Echinococcus granulosus TaxID=6210 RepID=A0A068WBE3_ECHGR|nr:hypothetical protein EgrG_000974800 [Echinococcus granulosus]